MSPSILSRRASRDQKPATGGYPLGKLTILLRRATAALEHEHIVAIHAVDQVQGMPFLVMQYIAGESLADRSTATAALRTHGIPVGLLGAADPDIPDDRAPYDLDDDEGW
jgi:hypothetical protein